MRTYSIRSCRDNSVLFEGVFPSYTACVEAAARHPAALPFADFSLKNLSNANLDDAVWPNACFIGANLSGANLSEATLSGSQFQDAELYNTCFALADLSHSRFEGAQFGATDIAGADVSHSRFSGLSCYTLDFVTAERMDNCRFINTNGVASVTSGPPVVIRGLPQGPLVLLDDAVSAGVQGGSHDASWLGVLRSYA